ncbi:unnamed protein product [Symbiodinium sp. CCMP2592]|nr:unnamed protein product [Symbiodinium sp. CCMP2592]
MARFLKLCAVLFGGIRAMDGSGDQALPTLPNLMDFVNLSCSCTSASSQGVNLRLRRVHTGQTIRAPEQGISTCSSTAEGGTSSSSSCSQPQACVDSDDELLAMALAEVFKEQDISTCSSTAEGGTSSSSSSQPQDQSK